METLAAALLTWVVAKTGLTAPALPPIAQVPSHRLVQIAFGPFPPMTTGVSALYDRKTGKIYMRDGWNEHDLMDQSELLHELVHHVQSANNVPAACPAVHEGQAIALQVEWLREQGVDDPHKFLGINELYVMLVSSCHDE
jgi:hypothetical protein